MKQLTTYAFRLTFLSLLTTYAFRLPTYGAFDNITSGARALALSGTFVARDDSVYSIYYNPAGISFLTSPQVAAEYRKYYPGMDDSSNIYSGDLLAAYPLRQNAPKVAEKNNLFTVGVGYQNLNLTDIYSESLMCLTFGVPVIDEVSAGLSIKSMQQKYIVSGNAYYDGDAVFLKSNASSAVDADFGVLVKPLDWLSGGLSLTNFTRRKYGISEDQISLDSTQRLGILFKEDTINFALEISRRTYERGSKYSGFISGEKFRYAAGVEKFLINKHSGEPRPSIRGMGDFPKLFNQEGRGEYLIALRAGFNWASALDSKNITTGVGVNIGNFLIDYGWSFPLSGIEETSGNHSLSLLFRFGKILFKEKKLTEKLVEPVELDYPPLPGSISTSITPTVAVVPMPGQLIVPGPGAMSVPAVPRITSGATVPFGPLPREAVTSYYIPPYISSAAALGVVRVSTTTEKYETLKQELISKMAISTPSIKTEGLKQTPLPAPPTFGAIPPVPEAGALPETDGLKAPEPSGVKSQGVSMPSAPGAAPSVPGIGGLPAIIPLPGLPLGSGKKAAAEAPEKVTAPKTGDRPQELPSEVSGKVEVPRRATAVSPVTSVPAVSKPPGTAPAVTAPAVPEKKTVPSEEVPGKRTYKVERGETLSSIAQKLYGDSGKWIKIYEANKDKIVKGIVKPGQKLIIPHKK